MNTIVTLAIIFAAAVIITETLRVVGDAFDDARDDLAAFLSDPLDHEPPDINPADIHPAMPLSESESAARIRALVLGSEAERYLRMRGEAS